ncbi:Putative histidine kinase containing cheY-homologous receiver domain [Klebsormidium nitens]|uniref:Putative histidine kinase containing cheY-homologous receiver domain n=1 Tax=Klebsormidium nitens TaxID=105231 RepID=A0A1Y1IPC0_KLENI|nr:Putative histidine kinase containing cheY-homologous receiver domain [Klebsormidium nitens]|eukprot:GAQ92735.1 Putative histidine kinase containing cheY-homologous receiver domain [Klebsormidium nitens]
MGRLPGRVLVATGTAAIFGGFLGFLIYSAAWSPAVRAASPLAESLESEVLTNIQRQLERTFDQVRIAVAGCALAVGMALNGSAESWAAIESNRPVLWGTLRGNAVFESAGFQAESNLSVSFVRPAEGGADREYRRTSAGSTVLAAYLVTDDWGASVPDPSADLTTPPLTDRPWYVRAVAQRGAVVFSGFVSVLGVPTVTASTAVSGPSGVLLGAVNGGLSVRRRLTQGLNATGDYVVFVVGGPNATLVASSSVSGGGGQLAAAVDNPDPLVSGSAGQLGSALTDGTEHRRVIVVRGRRYVAGVRRLRGMFDVTVVVLMPWDRFFAQLESNRRVTIGTFSSAVVLWVLFAGVIAACFVRLWRREQGHLVAANHDAAMHRKKQQLLATLSHELRTPMAVVMGVLEEMQDEVGGAFDENIRLLRRTSADMLHLLDGILMLAKNEAGKSNVESQPFDLRAELEQALAGIAPLVNPRGVRTWLQYGDGLSDAVIGDRRKLRQVVDNLLSNAAKFTESGEIGVVARRGAEGPDDSRGDNVRMVHGGTGLGLSIVRSLCRLMGGDIEIADSGPGGTTFNFWVRLVLAGSFRAQDVVVGAIDGPVPLKGLHVLVAEDTRLISRLIERLLTKEGAEATMTADGLELLEAYEARPGEYSAILMDLQMPRMDGYEATRRIRKSESEGVLPGRIPIIALTAHAMESDERECRRVGMSFYIRKPLDRGTSFRLFCDAPVPPTLGICPRRESQPPRVNQHLRPKCHPYRALSRTDNE